MDDMPVTFANGVTTSKFNSVTNEINDVRDKIDKNKEEICAMIDGFYNEFQCMNSQNEHDKALLASNIYDIKNMTASNYARIDFIYDMLTLIIRSGIFRFINHFAMLVVYEIYADDIIIHLKDKDMTRKEFLKKEKSFKRSLKKYPKNSELREFNPNRIHYYI